MANSHEVDDWVFWYLKMPRQQRFTNLQQDSETPSLFRRWRITLAISLLRSWLGWTWRGPATKVSVTWSDSPTAWKQTQSPRRQTVGSRTWRMSRGWGEPCPPSRHHRCQSELSCSPGIRSAARPDVTQAAGGQTWQYLGFTFNVDESLTLSPTSHICLNFKSIIWPWHLREAALLIYIPSLKSNSCITRVS